MSATFAPSPWPAPAAALRTDGWRFGRVLQAPPRWQFDLRRNVSLTPRQLIGAYLLLCAVSVAVAAGFWWHGVAMVGLFTGIELLLLGVAMWHAARHAGDRELVTLDSRELAVDLHVGAEVAHTRFRAEWVRVEPAAGDGSLVELSGQGQRVCIGRHLRPELRVELARELRRALQQARAQAGRFEDQETKAP